MPEIRLQKFLSAAGVCSRRKGEDHIRSGDVAVNGRTIMELGTRVDPETDQVMFKGELVRLAPSKIYIALNKPKGCVTSCDHPGKRVVLDLINIPERIFPIGRLDKDSTGLLLLTNDGPLHNHLSHPSFDHEKEYEVTVGKPIPDGALTAMAKGMPMMGTMTRQAEIQRLSAVQFRIILKEGRNRQIRRMVKKVGNHVTALKRIRVANIRLEGLPEGKWRHLTADERKELLVAFE